MSEAVRIRKNSLYSTLSITSRLIANVVVFWVLARYYGPKIFGQFSTAQNLATNFIIFADFGFDLLLTTEIARNRKNALQLFRQFYSLKAVFCLIALLSMWVISLFGNFSSETKVLIFILSLYTVFSTLTNFLFALYKGFEHLEYESKISLIINVGLLILILPLIIFKVNIFVIALVFVFSRVVGFIFGLNFVFKLLPKVSFKPLFENISAIRNKVIVFGLFLLFNNLFFQLDTIFLSLWKSDHDAGIYSAVFRFIMLPLVIPDILTNTLMPLLSRLNVENQLQWKKIGFLMNKILIAIVLPISIILFIYSEQIINIVYGSRDFAESVPVLKIFSLTLIVRFSVETYALLLTTSDRQKIRLYTVVVATILNLSINFFLIPLYGALGAAIVSLFTNIFVGVIYYLTNSNLIAEFLINIRTMLFFLFSIGLASLFWMIKSLNVFISLPMIGIIFMIFAYNFFFTKEEKTLILSREFKFSFFNNK